MKDNMIIEGIDEIFTNQSEEEFNKMIDSELYTDKNTWKNTYVYAATSDENLVSILQNSLSSQYLGLNRNDPGIFHGIGGYTCYTLHDAKQKLGGYGGTIIRYILKNGFKGFVMLDDAIRNKLAPGKTPLDQIKELMPPEVYQQLLNNLSKERPSGINLDTWLGVGTESERKGNSWLSDSQILNNFIRAMCYGEKKKPFHYGFIYDENLLAKTKIRGYLVSGRKQKHTAVVRDFGSLIPVAYSKDGGNTWVKNPYLTGQYFKNHNERVNPFFLYRGEYEDIPLEHQQSEGYTLVSGKKGYNLKNIWNHRHLLPFDADFATKFIDGVATFKISDLDFEMRLDEDGKNVSVYYVGDGAEMPVSYQDLMEMVALYQEMGRIPKDKQIYTDSTLADNNRLNEANGKKGTASLRDRMNAIMDAHNFLVSNGEKGIFSDVTLEQWNEIINACEEGNGDRSKKGLRWEFEDNPEYYTSTDAQLYCVSRMNNYKPLPDTETDRIIDKIRKPIAQEKQAEKDAKRTEAQSNIEGQLKNLFQICKNDYSEEENNAISEIVDGFNRSHRSKKPLAYYDGNGIYIPLIKKTETVFSGDYTIGKDNRLVLSENFESVLKEFRRKLYRIGFNTAAKISLIGMNIYGKTRRIPIEYVSLTKIK